MGKIFKALEKSEAELKAQPKAIKPVIGKKDSIPIKQIEKKTPKPKTKPVEKNINQYNKLLITLTNPHSVESEQFRLLKNAILFPDAKRHRKTIMVTSTDQSEGKSFVASNLAASIAMSIDEYVLLIDSDLRKPTVHEMFGLENDKGLSNFLQDGADLSDLLIKTFLKKLTILPGGPPPLNPSELVSSEQMKALINEVKARYEDRYVIIDSPPPYLTSETNALATYVDGIIIVVKQGYTKKKKLHDLIKIYGNKKVIGVVKNFATGKFGLKYGNSYKYTYHN